MVLYNPATATATATETATEKVLRYLRRVSQRINTPSAFGQGALQDRLDVLPAPLGHLLDGGQLSGGEGLQYIGVELLYVVEQL